MEILGVSYLLTGPTELVSCRIKGLHLVAEVPGGHLGFESFTLPKLRDLGRWWFVLLLVFLLMCLQVVSLRGHGGWSAGFQSHERAFSCTSIGKEDLEDCGSRAAVAKENVLLCRPGWDTTKPSVLLRLSYDKVPDGNNLQEERFILAHGFRDFGPWSPGPIVACLR
ncbi:uncharacterized protein isoform X4 [Castor canadensis]|uniref:Uncharacterized protein isoform X4 n=1 Tax=Castor canadensis TaxID=51338 RepID=A0AC58LPI3_CASCN